MKRSICFYKAQASATKYRNELEARYPNFVFLVLAHPSEFGFTVAHTRAGCRVYVAPRPNHWRRT